MSNYGSIFLGLLKLVIWFYLCRLAISYTFSYTISLSCSVKKMSKHHIMRFTMEERKERRKEGGREAICISIYITDIMDREREFTKNMCLTNQLMRFCLQGKHWFVQSQSRRHKIQQEHNKTCQFIFNRTIKQPNLQMYSIEWLNNY